MKYIALLSYSFKYFDFTISELYALGELAGAKNLRIDPNYKRDIKNEPYVEIYFDNIEDKSVCQKIIERSVLTKSIIKVYSEGKNIDEVVQNLKREDIQSEIDSQETFKFYIDYIRNTLTQKQKLELLDKLNDYKFTGKCNLKNPDRVFVIFQNYPEDYENPYCCLGKVIAGQNEDEKKYFADYDLHKRKYLGPTTTDHVLAFLMANLGKVERNHFIIDPFAGTGGLLIPPTYFGAFVYGCDLDHRVLKGFRVGYTRKEGKFVHKEEDIFSSFLAYGMPKPQIIRQDINLSVFRKKNLIFDAVICDPPYGYRAGSLSTGMEKNKREKREKRIKGIIERNIEKDKLKKEKKENVKEDEKDEKNIDDKNIDEKEEKNINNEEEEVEVVDYNTVIIDGKMKTFRPVKQCSTEIIFENLINFANECLRVGGLLVFLYPVKLDEDEQTSAYYPVSFPQHPSFKLKYACENKYSLKKSRWCLVYTKIN